MWKATPLVNLLRKPLSANTCRSPGGPPGQQIPTPNSQNLGVQSMGREEGLGEGEAELLSAQLPSHNYKQKAQPRNGQQ